MAYGCKYIGDQSYKDYADKLINVFFLDPDTRMDPAVKYAQSKPGAEPDGNELFVVAVSTLEHLPSTSPLSRAGVRQAKLVQSLLGRLEGLARIPPCVAGAAVTPRRDSSDQSPRTAGLVEPCGAHSRASRAGAAKILPYGGSLACAVCAVRGVCAKIPQSAQTRVGGPWSRSGCPSGMSVATPMVCATRVQVTSGEVAGPASRDYRRHRH